MSESQDLEQNKSILDLKDQHRLAATVHQLQDWQKEVDGDMWMIWEILSTLFNIAVCDYCKQQWFTCEPVVGFGPRGDVRGLLVAGGACCTKCLDRLYVDTVDMDEAEMEGVFQAVASWLLKYRCNMNLCDFGKDPYIKALMERLAP